ncbi:helix-turn-helix domain-containing protein [Paramixta manurensis]|uniref:Helix-turn-helix domain-containing protein n=1 Tax=Paramixta manurensis TaxID=2740817 RepID=A0A6M8UKX7_9GAMM|nr:helix-turn-helix domain-containing protein [Erwiniaceae bacterium PD-1]
MSALIYRIIGKDYFFIVNHEVGMTTLTSYPLSSPWENAVPHRTVVLKPTESRLLMLLLLQGGHTVTKATIMESVWKNKVVTDNSLRQVILSLRSILDDRVKPHHVLKNVPGIGYNIMNSECIGCSRQDDAVQEEPGTSIDGETNNVSLFKKIWRIFMAF